MVVNCSGLRARELVNDLSVHPIRGQILKVRYFAFISLYSPTFSVLVKQRRLFVALVHPGVGWGGGSSGTKSTSTDLRFLYLLPRLSVICTNIRVLVPVGCTLHACRTEADH